MNALRSFASQVVNTIDGRRRPSSRARDEDLEDRSAGEESTSTRLSDRLPEVIFDDKSATELKLKHLWEKFHGARTENKSEEARVLLQVLLKDVIAKTTSWSPNAHLTDADAQLSRSKEVTVKGCKFGQPKAFISSLAEELETLSQSVYYVLERELFSESDLQAGGGLRLLHTFTLLLASEYNQVVFLDSGGLQSVSKIIRNAINQLHVCTTSANTTATNTATNQDSIQRSKIDYLYSLLTHSMQILSPFLSESNILSKNYQKYGLAQHPLIRANICSSQSIADYVELLQIIRSITTTMRHAVIVSELQASVLEIIKVGYKVNDDAELLDVGIIESIVLLVGEYKGYNDQEEVCVSLPLLTVQIKALEVIAIASRKHAVIVQHFLQSDGVLKLHQWILLLVKAIPSCADECGKMLESVFQCLHMQVKECKENERYIEALLSAMFGLLSEEEDLLWKYQCAFLVDPTPENSRMALYVLDFKKEVLQWIAVLLLTSKFTITLLRRHECWGALFGRSFFRLCIHFQGRLNDDNLAKEGEGEGGPIMKGALECQAFVSSLLYKTITSSWNALPEIEIKLLLKEGHLLALQPGSCIQLVNVLRKFANTFKLAETSLTLDRADCSSGLGNIMQKQRNAKKEEWVELSSDQNFLVGLVEEGGGVKLDLSIKARKHLLVVLRDVLSCHIAVEEYFIKQWNAIGALFSLIWEQEFQHDALDMVKQLLKMSPTNTDSEIAKSVLFTRYVEALPRAQNEIHNTSSGLNLVFLLLEGIQETISTDINHQKLFNECETILHVFNLLNEDFSESEGPELCRSVLKTLGFLVSGNIQGRKHLERTIGWDTMQELVFHCVKSPIPFYIFLELFNIATDQILERGKSNVNFVSVKLVPTMLNILKRCNHQDARSGLLLVHSVLRGSIADCSACSHYGVTAQLFEWFQECSAEGKEVQDSIVKLIQTIGKISLSAKDLRTVLRTCYGCQATMLDEVKLLQAISVLKDVVNHDGPTDFLDLDGVTSGLQWQGQSPWGGNKAYSFSAWLRFESSNLDKSQGKVLYSLIGKTIKNDPYSVVVVLESTRILLHTLESKLHSVTLDIDVPIGTWFHLGVVHDNSSTFGSSVVSVYVNGRKKNMQKLKYPKNFEMLTGISIGCLQEEDSTHNVCRWLSRLKGQMSCIFLFQDALSEKHMLQICRIGPNVAFSRLIKGFNTGDMLFLALKEKAKTGNVLYNVVQPGAPIAMVVLEGTHICCTRVMQDMIQCIGGIGVILTLFGNLYLKYASLGNSSGSMSTMLTNLFHLLGTLATSSILSINDLINMEGLPILSYLIRKVDAKHLDADIVGAMEDLLAGISDTNHQTLFHQSVKHLLLDLNWWGNVSKAVQKPYIELLLRVIRTDYKLIRGSIDIPQFLDGLRGQIGKVACEMNSSGEKVCPNLVVRGYLEAVVILMERTFSESDVIALLCFCNDNVNEDITFVLLNRINLYLRSESSGKRQFIDLVSRIGGTGLLFSLTGSQNPFVGVQALDLFLLASKQSIENEELEMYRAMLENFGVGLSSVVLDKSLLLKLIALLRSAKHPELYIVYVLFPILPKFELAERKVVLTYCIKLLSKTRHSVEAFVKKLSWQEPLVGTIVDGFTSLPATCQTSLSKTGSKSITNEVTISWNILISLLFYCVRYKDDGSTNVEYTLYHFLWKSDFRKEDSTILFPQLVSDILKMILLSDQVTKPAAESWTTVEALECEACMSNIIDILPLCQDILLGIFMPGCIDSQVEESESKYDAVSSIPSLGKHSSGADLWKELGLKIHLIDGSGEGNSPLPIHKDVAAEFCEICVSVIFKLCFGSGRSASCFSKYIIKDQSESAEELKTAKDPRTSQSASKAVESLKAESIKCIFQVTMRLFTLMLNVLSEQGRGKEIAQDICTIVQCCILSSHLSANDISIYREAMQYAKESSEFSAVHKELCQQVYHSLSYGPKNNDAPEQPDLSKLFCAERLYRENAKQQRMLQISTLEKNLEGKSEQIDESRSKYTEEVRTLSQSFSDLDANRRLNASMDSLEAFQQAESDWKSIVRKLRSETGIWASESVQNLRWKLDFTEDFIRRRMKLKRLYSSREYATSSSLSARASESERDRQIISKLPANAIKIGADMDQELPNELQASQEEFAEADDSSPVMPEKKLERSDSIAFSDTAFSAECKLVTVKRVVPGKIHIDRGKLYFSGKAQEHSNLFGKEVPDPSAGKSKRICINVNQIREIHFMRYMLEPSACEIFLEHRGVFLAFESRDEMKRTVKTISMLKPAILVVTGRKKLSLAEIYSSQWRKGEISNFNYLMKLNTLAGRTYNDLSQYPVFPWILADYESEELDLENPEVYRDLSKPVGALDDKRKAVVEERYALSVETDDPARAFHYGSHYSTAGIILYYLIRVEPFTFLHSVLQGGKLDHADRLFNSIGATWNNCNHHSADVKELIPEFFCLPEMFENTNCIDFGTRQDGKVVSQAELPPWAHGSPTEFVKVHRNALESDYVSSHLHSWIDLVFGFKQRGKAAVQAVNVFHYLSYEGNVDISAIEDEFERKVVKDHILHFGQTPSQLFRKKQQARSVKGRKSFWTLQEMKMSLSLARVPSQRSVRYCSILNARIVILDQEAFVHYYKWVTPKAKDMSFTFTASAPADFSIEFDRTSDLLRNQYGSSIGKRHNHFAVLAKSNVLLSIGHWDNSIRCYSLDDFKCCQSVSCHQDAITCVDVGYEEKVVVTGSRDTTVIVWRIIPSASKSGKAAQAVLRDNPMHILYGHQDEVSCVCLSVPLNLVISAGVGGRILFHSLQEGEYVRQFTLSGSSPSKMLAGNTSGLILIYCQRDLKLYTMTVNGGVISSTEIGFRVSSLAWTHEGQHVVIGGEKGTISVRDAYNLQQIKKYDTGTSVNVVVTPEDCLVAACSDGNLFVVKPV